MWFNFFKNILKLFIKVYYSLKFKILCFNCFIYLLLLNLSEKIAFKINYTLLLFYYYSDLLL